MIWLALVVVVLTLGAALAVVLLDNLLAAVAAASAVSLGVALMFVLLQAPDVAMTEAVMSASQTTASVRLRIGCGTTRFSMCLFLPFLTEYGRDVAVPVEELRRGVAQIPRDRPGEGRFFFVSKN